MTGAYPSREPPPGSVVAVSCPHREIQTASKADPGYWCTAGIPLRGLGHGPVERPVMGADDVAGPGWCRPGTRLPLHTGAVGRLAAAGRGKGGPGLGAQAVVPVAG